MRLKFLTFFLLASALCINAQLMPNQKFSLKNPDSIQIQNSPPDTLYDTVYVAINDGIPWNTENFNKDRLLRQESFDPALTVGYTYSIAFISGPLGSLSHTSYLAHLNYEFSPDLHLYADLGLWMPLYSTLHHPNGFAREDIRQGNVQFVIPDVELEYNPSPNTSVRLMLVNESDMIKAYGLHRTIYRPYATRRNSTFWY